MAWAGTRLPRDQSRQQIFKEKESHRSGHLGSTRRVMTWGENWAVTEC